MTISKRRRPRLSNFTDPRRHAYHDAVRFGVNHNPYRATHTAHLAYDHAFRKAMARLHYDPSLERRKTMTSSELCDKIRTLIIDYADDDPQLYYDLIALAAELQAYVRALQLGNTNPTPRSDGDPRKCPHNAP